MLKEYFSVMILVKNKLRNSMGNELMKHCLVTFIEQGVFINVGDDSIVETFMAVRNRRLKK
jgi:hypothetical protein